MVDEPDVMLTYLDVYHAAAVMRAISSWARFEYGIDELIWKLLRVEPPQGACLTAQFPNVIARMNALIALARVENIPAKHVAALNALVVDMRGPQEDRNRLVHDPWFSGMETKQHYRLQTTARAKLDHAYKPVTEAEVKAIEERFESLNARFGRAASDLLGDFYKL